MEHGNMKFKFKFSMGALRCQVSGHRSQVSGLSKVKRFISQSSVNIGESRHTLNTVDASSCTCEPLH
jgi:hypothetical protein